MPRSASRDSPGPFTTHPMTATEIGALTVASLRETSSAIPMRLTWQRPHVGQLTSSGCSRRMPSEDSRSHATLTSSTGSAVSERRMVSPMPCSSRMPTPTQFLTVP